MGDLHNPRTTDYWHRELTDLAGAAGSTTSAAVRTRQSTFLAEFVRTGAPVVAAAQAGVTVNTTKKWAAEDPIFFEARALAVESYSDLLVAEMTRRAVDGQLFVVRDRHGEIVGEERKFSDDLLKFALKGLDAHARWTQRTEAARGGEGAWRADLARILADPEQRAALEAFSELLGKG